MIFRKSYEFVMAGSILDQASCSALTVWNVAQLNQCDREDILTELIYSIVSYEFPDILAEYICNSKFTACVYYVLTWLKVAHKKTLFYVEQLLLKHRAHVSATGIKQVHGELQCCSSYT